MAGSASIGALFTQRVVVGVGDLAVSNNTQMVLSTYALGSCIGVLAYDPIVKTGGILHLMLPESSIAPHKVATHPAMFADTGLPALMRALVGLRADRSRLRVLVAGGASVLGGVDPFKIGERNAQVALDWLAREAITVRHVDVGGTVNRTVHLDVNTGVVTLKQPTATTQHPLA